MAGDHWRGGARERELYGLCTGRAASGAGLCDAGRFENRSIFPWTLEHVVLPYKAIKNIFDFVVNLLTVFVIAFTLIVRVDSNVLKVNSVTDALKLRVVDAARTLFLTRGYDAVGMREIARAVGRQPVQIYRLNLAKSDILAEVVIELNAEEIRQLPELLGKVRGASLMEKVCSYLLELYRLDIQYLPIRSVGAAFGWMWHGRYEAQVIAQVRQLLQPVAGWLAEAGLADIEARGYGIWSVYYVGFRRAVIHGGSAEDCLAEIRPSLEILLDGMTSVTPTISLFKGEIA